MRMFVFQSKYQLSLLNKLSRFFGRVMSGFALSGLLFMSVAQATVLDTTSPSVTASNTHQSDAFRAEDLSVITMEAVQPVAKVLWIPSEYGVLPQEVQVARNLQAKGLSVSIPDFFESYFLPVAPSSLRKVPPSLLTQLIEKLQSESPELPLYVIASNQAAALAVKALVQVEQTPQHNIGLILLNPNLYIKTPEAGKNAEYWPSVAQLNLPVSVLQAELSPWRWHLPALNQQLTTSGSSVFIKVLLKVRDRYYFRPDALPVEQQLAKNLGEDLRLAMDWLSPYLSESRQAGHPQTVETNETSVSQSVDKAVSTEASKTSQSSAGLPVYEGAQNRTLVLKSLEGQTYNLADYRGKVVLLNFWASWCPPCVHEMPSMARLKSKLKGQKFEILAANLAEDAPAIQTFVKAHPVNFPILLDPKGTAVKSWKVFAYPSSYLIDKKGQIRYALFGGYEWDNPEAIKAIEALINE